MRREQVRLQTSHVASKRAAARALEASSEPPFSFATPPVADSFACQAGTRLAHSACDMSPSQRATTNSDAVTSYAIARTRYFVAPSDNSADAKSVNAIRICSFRKSHVTIERAGGFSAASIVSAIARGPRRAPTQLVRDEGRAGDHQRRARLVSRSFQIPAARSEQRARSLVVAILKIAQSSRQAASSRFLRAVSTGLHFPTRSCPDALRRGPQ